MAFIHDESPQNFYNSFNNFIFSPDKKVFHKLMTKYKFIHNTITVPGEIVELGVFKGSGFIAWLKMLRYLGCHKKVIGFDFFDQYENLESLTGLQKDMMKNLFEQRNFTEQKNYEVILNEIALKCGFTNFELIKGDVINTVSSYVKENPGFRCSIVNFDLDTALPTYHCMNELWDRLVPGGVFIFDEYGINEWDESHGVDRFMRERGIRNIVTTDEAAPTAFIVK